jgi:hypothetical protein
MYRIKQLSRQDDFGPECGMTVDFNQVEALRGILERCHEPQLLDNHPWTKILIVRQASVDMPELADMTPGQRLVFAISRLFTEMMPATPPRRGKRLDTRWGEFGILAAQYFAPVIFGEPTPASLRDAWGRLDRCILLFVYGKPADKLQEAEKTPYKLVGNELGVAPNSTLSDWHRNGLDRLLELIVKRESYLSVTLSKPAVIFQNNQLMHGSDIRKSKRARARIIRYIFLFLGILLLGAILFGGYEGWRIYKQAMLVQQEAILMRSLLSSPGPQLDRIKAVGPDLSSMLRDFGTLEDETRPLLWIGPWLGWVPVYGGDLASLQGLMDMADSLLSCLNLSYQAVTPLLGGDNQVGINPTVVTNILLKSQPQLIEAAHELDLATTARSDLYTTNLTPSVRELILNDIDPLLPLLRDGLSLAEDFPRLMGATVEGPKTYLILVENEDELRPTGGLVTAVGTLLMENGSINAMTFQNEDVTINPLVDWAKPYPAAPWQLQQYMNSRVLLLRDTSWFTNYPTAALYAETLYSYVKGYSVNGEIAFDQHFLVEILKATGPIQLNGVPYPIDASNVVTYMRSAKIPTTAELASPDWNNKLFIKKISDALETKIFSGKMPPETLFTVLLRALNEHHLLLKLDSPSMTALLASHRWDGAVRPEKGDFLMEVDTNVGFNKTNAVESSNLVYDVDLTEPATPIGSLTVVHKNNATGIICKQWDKIRLPGEEDYPITDCYWDYMRVYMASGTKLLDSTPQFVPANWMLVKQDIPARVDNLDEGISGVQAFGTLQVVPGGESVLTSFRFSLPKTILQSIAGQSIYHLLVQKQPGTLAEPITIRVHLPSNATLQNVPVGAVVQDRNILYQANLQTDLRIEIVFRVP